ncbi:TylF/MycF/NovP-related O-methyltransferase [Paludibaculum fermentans]|uniref:TylF/MycF/NovP-related O-methyltransferase n=1 Tax=Paludibaculum fermentans TaxID=1473598 RepID=UPI003EB8CFD2
MLKTAKRLAKPVLQRLTASFYPHRPLATWPPFVGRIHGISVPRGVVPHPEPQPIGSANINNVLSLFDRTRNVPGEIAECGVYRGSTLVSLAMYAAQQGVRKAIHGFDSFEGFAESIVSDQQLGGADIDCKHPGGMNETSYELVAGKLKLFGLHNVELHKGFFEHTLQQCSALSFSFVHLDCDAYDAYMDCMKFFYPRLSRGGVILFDEYNDPPWPGCNKAIDEYLADKPERCEPIAHDNFVKYFIVKQ